VRLTRHGDRRRPGVREVRRARGGDGPRGGSFGGRGAPNGTFFSLLGRALALTSCRGRRAVGPEGFLARGSLEAVDVLAHAGRVVRGGQHGGCAEGVRVGRKRERNVGRDDANEPIVFDAVLDSHDCVLGVDTEDARRTRIYAPVAMTGPLVLSTACAVPGGPSSTMNAMNFCSSPFSTMSDPSCSGDAPDSRMPACNNV
jgi:hypothetical protein